jgi:hypothetical protein
MILIITRENSTNALIPSWPGLLGTQPGLNTELAGSFRKLAGPCLLSFDLDVSSFQICKSSLLCHG